MRVQLGRRGVDVAALQVVEDVAQGVGEGDEPRHVGGAEPGERGRIDGEDPAQRGQRLGRGPPCRRRAGVRQLVDELHRDEHAGIA